MSLYIHVYVLVKVPVPVPFPLYSHPYLSISVIPYIPIPLPFPAIPVPLPFPVKKYGNGNGRGVFPPVPICFNPTGDEDRVHAQEAAGAASHLIEARDRFSELGIPLISRRLAFQGPDIDPYLRYAIQVDVASMVKELGEMLRLDPSEAGTSSQVSSRTQPALPEDVESFDVDGKLLSAWFSLFFPVL